MRKRTRKWLSLLVASAMLWGAAAPFAATVAEARATQTLSLMWQTPIGEGTTLHKYTAPLADGKRATVYLTRVELTNPYVEVKPVYGKAGYLTDKQTVTKMANETGAVAAVNADFFNMTKRGAPFGIVMKDKELVSSMGHIAYWHSLGITADKTAVIERFGYTGKVTAADGTTFPLRGVNKEEYNPTVGKSHLDQLNLYTPSFGKTSLGAISGYQGVVEVVFVDNVAVEVRENQPGAPIPADGFVLWGHGQAAQFLKQHVPVGSTVAIDQTTTPLDREWLHAVGGHLLLVNDGQPITTYHADSYLLSPNARTAVGVSQDGKILYILTVEHSSTSQGVTLPELARIMAELGAYRAVNFDGGGSTTLSARMLGDTQAKMVNVPRSGSERRVPTGLAVYNTAPPGELAGFTIQGPSELLIGQTAEFAVKGWDNHYLPYAIQPSELRWEINRTGSGTFDGNRFTATRSGALTLTAEVRGVTQRRDIRVIGAVDVQELVVSPSPIHMAPGQTLTLDVIIKTRDGKVYTATPESVQVTSDSPLVQTDGNLQVTAGEQDGKANVTVSYDGVKRTVPVLVGEAELPWLTFDNQTSMHHAGYPESLSNSGSFTAVADPVFRSRKAAKLTYNFAHASHDEVRIAYGRIGSKPREIPGQPFGLGLWVYGDNSRHWLRAEVVDAAGKRHFVNLADEVNWTGWKQVKGYFPGDVKYPVSLLSIYLVNKPEETETRPEKGTVYFDEVSLLYPSSSVRVPAGRDVNPAAPGKMDLGSELDLAYSFVKTSGFLEQARIDVSSNVTRSVPGYVTADYSFTIKPVKRKPGRTDQLSTQPAVITLTPKNWIAGKGIGLLYVNEANHTLDPLMGRMDLNGNWVYELNAYGTYIPYYLDKPQDVPFWDVLHHPAREEIAHLTQRGIIKGLTPDLFGPEASLTRAQFTALLARTFQWQLPAKPQLPFKDAIPAYAQGAVQAAVAKGIIKGYPDKTFRPDQPITRAEAAVMLDRLLKQTPKSKPKAADSAAWPKWAQASVQNMLGQGLIDPVNNRFEPGKPTTRAVMAVALYRILQNK